MNRKLPVVAAFVTVFTATSALAWWGEGDNEDPKNNEYKYEHRDCGKKREQGFKGRFGKKNLKEYMAREFTADEIRTLASARLLMKGNSNVKVGEVKANDQGYTVSIVTKDDSLVKEWALAKNGMPLDRFERIQKRMEKKEKQ
ncbi:hypothetical protein [Endozoicomonas numazuensis]|uniref:Uncharacterized protein n=1 Tax=Endozoicomonas numazuensis TaxID=1137799 RepID=A0A081NGM9_9GAMM|nr:hypothetical protein [Endozoicomonas numazuensis]KEQ17602.1 hypothetical protein GZ78_17900 [Endozoicomonas numazuensis]